MKNKPINRFFRYAIPVIRIIIGMAFFLSGLLKIIDLKGFQKVIEALGLLGGPLPVLASIILPVLELVLGLMLVLGVYIRVAAIHINVLVIIFSWVTFYVLRSRPDMLCGCFGGFIDMTFGKYHFIVLFFIFILNLFLIVEPSDNWTLQKFFRERIPAAKKIMVIEVFTYVLIALGIILIGFTLYMNFWGQRDKTEAGEQPEDTVLIVEEEPSQAGTSTEGSQVQEEQAPGEASSGDSTAVEIIDMTVDEAYDAYYSNKGYVFVDVRSQSEYDSGHIKGAVHIPVSVLEDRISELPKDRPIVVYCNGSSCNRSGVAAVILVEYGFDQVYDLTGQGIDEWIAKGYPSE